MAEPVELGREVAVVVLDWARGELCSNGERVSKTVLAMMTAAPNRARMSHVPVRRCSSNTVTPKATEITGLDKVSAGCEATNRPAWKVF